MSDDDDVKAYQLNVDQTSPDWRWAFACRCRARGERLGRSFKDQIVKRCWRFHGHERRTLSMPEQFRIFNKYRDIAEAKKMFSDTTSERWFVEAGILANASTEEIAQYVGRPVATILMYEKAFFDIREKLGSKGYIANRIVMPTYTKGADGRDVDFLLKIVAYYAGWEIFQEFVGMAPLSDTAKGYLNTTYEDNALKNAWKAAARTTVNNFNSAEVQGVFLQLQAMKSNAANGLSKNETHQALLGLLGLAETTVRKGHESLEINEPRVMKIMAGEVCEDYVPPTPATETPIGAADATAR